MLNIPASVLRFWEKKGLFHSERAENQYRKYALTDLIHIADVAFFRNLSIPISTIEKMDKFSLDDYYSTLIAMEQDIEKRIVKLQNIQNHLSRKSAMLFQILQKNYQEFVFEDLPFSCIVPFSYTEGQKTMRYLEDTSVYVRYWDTNDLTTETRGIIVESASEKDILWKKTENVKWCTFLIKEIAELDYESNVVEKLSIVQKRYRTGVMLAQFVITAFENGHHVDYLKAYVEILEER